MEPTPLTPTARAASWRVFALVLLSASYFFQSSGHNEAARFDQMRSVTEHGEWWIDRYASNTADAIRIDGHIYPNKAPGTTLLGLLPWKIARLALGLLPIPENQQLVLVTYLLTLLMSALPTALTSLLILRFLSRNGWAEPHATLLGLGYGLGTIAFPWATVLFSHQIAASFAFSAFYLIWSSRDQDSVSRARRLVAAGMLLGFLPVIEYPGALASVLIGLYALITVGPRPTLLLIAGGALGALPLPLYNEIALGSPAVLSYSFYKEGSPFPAHRQGLAGVSWPRLNVLREITIRPQRGLFHANPWLAFILVAPFLRKRVPGLARELALAASIVVAFLLFNAGFGDSIVYWGGAFSFGPRHILIALPFAVLLAAMSMRVKALAPPMAALTVVTMLLMLTAAAVEPRLPYEPAEPFFGFYLPMFSRGFFSGYPWATFDQTVLFASPGAFNLGRAAGLPRDLEILPLTIVWGVAAFGLFTVPSRRIRFAAAIGAIAVVALGLWPARSRLGPSPQAGLCQAISVGTAWPYFADYALQDEPLERPIRLRVDSPSIPLTSEADTVASGRLATVAVTFSGQFEPEVPGWYILRVEVIGQAALYIDGLHRVKIEGPAGFKRVQAAQVYLSKARHELVVRYMSDQPVRQLSVSTALRNTPPSPLLSGLTSRACR